MPLASFLKYRENEKYVRQLCMCCGPDTSLPPEWEARIRQRVLTEARRTRRPAAPAEVPATPPGISRFRWFMSGLGAAAGLLLVAGAIWWLALGGTRTAVADFATVLQKVAQARSVEYDEIIRIPGKPEAKFHVQMAKPSKVRLNWQNGEVHISDWESGKAIKLFPDTKTARTGRVFGRSDPLAQLEEAHVDSGRFIGKEILGNQNTSLYEVSISNGRMKVWVDPVEELPVRLEVRTTDSNDDAALTILEGFRWNPQIDERQFALEPPTDYTLAQRPTEDSLVATLRILAEHNSGAFPKNIDVETVTGLVVMKSNSVESADTESAGEYVTGKNLQESRESYRTCMAGLAYIEQISKEGGWHYSGSGVRLGDGTKIIFWWKQGPLYRAIYADLKIKEVMPEDVSAPSPLETE